MARLMVPAVQAIAKDPNNVKFSHYLRFHEADKEDVVLKSPEAFAAMYGAVRKP